MVDRVFVVEQGEYSDRHIVAIFNDETEFKAYCAANKEEFEKQYDSLSAFIMPITHCEKSDKVKNVVYYRYNFEETPDYPLGLQWVGPCIINKEDKKNQINSRPFIEHIEGKGFVKTDKFIYVIQVYLDELNDEKATKIAADMLAVEKAKVEGIA